MVIKRTWRLALWLFLGVVILATDYFSGPNVAVSYFFVVPVALAAHYEGRFWGFTLALVMPLSQFCFRFAWARPDQDLTQMLVAGELDAAIYGAALPNDPRLKSVIPDPEAAARGWFAKHHLVPVNHMVVVTDELARSTPKAVAELYRLLEEGRRVAGSNVPFGENANRPGLELLLGYAQQQGLVPQGLSVEELW